MNTLKKSSEQVYIIDLSRLLLMMPLHCKSNTYSKQRRTIISQENLHIDEQISYERFTELYKKYGNGLPENIFAQSLLDMPYSTFNAIKRGAQKVATILSKEYVSPKEFEKIKQNIIEAYNFTSKSKADYTTIMEMYEKFGGKLSVRLFVENVLGVTSSNLRSLKSSGAQTIIFKEKELSSQEAEKIRLDALQKSNLHIGDTITLEQFQNLHEQFGKQMTEKSFAMDILGIAPNQYNDLERGKHQTVTLLSTYKVNPKLLDNLRQKVILNENLHVNETISYSRFQELYQKHGSILPEYLFAEEILDLSQNNIKGMRLKNSVSPILTSIKISEEFVNICRDYIIKKYRLEQNQLITFDEFQSLHKKYAYILSEEDFATLVLDIPKDHYYSLRSGEYSSTSILKKFQTTNFEKLKRQVINENNLHYGDPINYIEFQKLHKRYAPNTRESVFAENILDIKRSNLEDIKRNGFTTKILLDEALPSKEKCERLKRNIAINSNFHISDQIDYATFKSLHKRYGGILSEHFFACEVLDLDVQTLYFIRKHPDKLAHIFTKTNPTSEEIAKLKSEVKAKHNLDSNEQITFEKLKLLYNSHKTILSMPLFANLILGISRSSFNKLKSGTINSIPICFKLGFTSQEIASLAEYLAQDLPIRVIAKRMKLTVSFLENSINYLLENCILLNSQILYKKIEFLKSTRSNGTNINELSDEQFNKQLNALEAQAIQYEKLEAAKLLSIKNKSTISSKLPKSATQKSASNKFTSSVSSKPKSASEKILLSMPSLNRRVAKIFEYDIFTEKHRLFLKKYISSCETLFRNGAFPESSLKFLNQAMELIECSFSDIKLFSEICISFSKYTLANGFISTNISSDKISSEEAEKLRELQVNIRYAIRKENAVRLIKTGQESSKYIAEATGILEIDAIKLLRNLSNEKSSLQPSISEEVK